MLENMQRSSSLFQSRVQKSENKAAEKAQEQKQPEQTQSQDQLDFSSEFSNQDTGLGSQDQGVKLSSWEDLIEDDDWLSDDGDEDEEDGEYHHEHAEDGSEGEEEDSEQTYTPPADWQPPKRSGFFPVGGSSPQAPPAAKVPDEPDGTVEEKLGFEWGPVQERQEKPQESATPDLSKGSGTPNLESRGNAVPAQRTPAPLAANRRGGWETFPKQPVIPDRPRPTGGIMLPPRGQIEQVEDRVVSAASLLIRSPEGEPGYDECIRLLSRFGLGAIRLCNRAKVGVHILDEKDFLSFPALAEMELPPEDMPVDGAYLVEERACLIDRRCLTEKPQFFHPALYYFAHALDHAQGGEDFSSRKAAAVLACFDASCSGLHGCDFVDELAAADPVRYFARSVAIYLGRDDCTDPIWTHQDLYDFDRSMYDYLQYLFARFSV